MSAFCEGARTGHSHTYHVEEHTLLAERFVPVAMRLSIGCLLIRTDVPSSDLENSLRSEGATRVEVDPSLATVVSLQILGLPAASWDLWSFDVAGAQGSLERAALEGLSGAQVGPG